jgi:hypothetical protein
MRTILAVLAMLMPGVLLAQPLALVNLRPSERPIAAQLLLKQGGFLNGMADGHFGPASQEALDDWREAEGRIGRIGAPLLGDSLYRLGKAFGPLSSADIGREDRGCALTRGQEVQFYAESHTTLRDAVWFGNVQAVKDGRVRLRTRLFYNAEMNRYANNFTKSFNLDCAEVEPRGPESQVR